MSTFFLSLLSRTLQTLLSKYLCDVDVEGVALPSYFSEEGYGVRLKNVKLRDKTKLLDLPGQWTPRKHSSSSSRRSWKQRKRKPTSTSASSEKQQQQHNPSNRHDKDATATTQQQQQDTTTSPSGAVVATTSTTTNHPKLSTKRKSSWFSSWYYGSSIEEEEEEQEDDKNDRMFQDQSQNTPNNTHPSSPLLDKRNDANTRTKDPVISNVVDTEVGVTTDQKLEQANKIPETTMHLQEFNPKSPPMRRTSWFSSWFYGKESDDKDDDDDEVKHSTTIITDHMAGSCAPVGNVSSDTTDRDVTDNHNEKEIPTSVLSPPKTDPLIGTLSNQIDDDGEHGNDNGVMPLDKLPQSCDDNDVVQQCDDPIPDDTDLILRLGEGGTIGVLDVRVVGKTIHVLIEDAVLTVEVVRMRKKSQNDDTDDNNNINKNSQPKPPTATSSTTTTSNNHAAKHTSNNSSEPKTTGDRVLAENAIAKIFSVIPNLFLRDIRIRVIIREDEIVTDSETDDNGNTDEEFSKRDFASSDNTIIDIAIELLSVNDGDDFLTNFGAAVSGADGEGSDVDSQQDSEPSYDIANTSGQFPPVNSAGAPGIDDGNEYLLKRIRTGRGPEGGILVKIFNLNDLIHIQNSMIEESRWARDRWFHTTQSVVLRCSGLDLLARIYLGTKKEVAISNNSWYVDENEYSDFDVDAMLFGGVDYIVPGPQQPLPPQQTPVHIQNGDNAWRSRATRCYSTDDNGIQSCGILSYFHKIARGLYPAHCNESHLPCDFCDECWKKDSGSASSHELDSSIPMGGLICHVCIRDPLEINLDRNNLETIGRILNVFTRKAKATTEHGVDSKTDGTTSASVAPDDEIHNQSSAVDDSRRSQISKKEIPRFVDESTRSNKTTSEKHRRSISKIVSPSQSNLKNVCLAAYPKYMTPEKIQILGFYIAEIKIRIHVLKKHNVTEDGYSFCYWDFFGLCVTADFQKLTAPERPFQDLEIDIAQLSLSECQGVECKKLISIGSSQRSVSFDDMIVAPFVPQRQYEKPPWPSTAAGLLDLSPPLESLSYEDRSRHALQFRYIAVLDQSEVVRTRKVANVRLGCVTADIPFAVRNDIMTIVSESRLTVLGPPRKQDSNLDLPVVDSILKYKVTAMSGNVSLTPLIQANFPLTTVVGEISTRAGFSVQSFLNQVNAQFGQCSERRALDSGLSLQQLADLPDNIRLRMLLFLDDLKPLEAALGIPKTSNPFLRTRECNKGVVKLAKKQARRTKQEKKKLLTTRRRDLLNELLSLDDDSLETLLRNHRSCNGVKLDDS